jgi:hypothetical protein
LPFYLHLLGYERKRETRWDDPSFPLCRKEIADSFGEPFPIIYSTSGHQLVALCMSEKQEYTLTRQRKKPLESGYLEADVPFTVACVGEK